MILSETTVKGIHLYGSDFIQDTNKLIVKLDFQGSGHDQHFDA